MVEKTPLRYYWCSERNPQADYWIALPWMQETALKLQQINFPTEISMPVPYKKIEVASNLRCDLSTENC